MDYKDILQNNIETVGSPFVYRRIGNVDAYAIGCNNSLWDSVKIAEIINNSYSGEVIVVDTCSLINDRYELAVGLVELLNQLYPDKRIFITGCGVDYNKSDFEKYGICLGRFEKFNIQRILGKYGFESKHDTFVPRETSDMALVKIQDGCNKNCAYCIEPKINGSPFSIPLSDIMKHIDDAIMNGYTKVKFVGTEMTDYRNDMLSLTDMLEQVLKKYPYVTFSIGSLDPGSNVVDDVIRLMNEYGNFDSTLYLATQSLCDEVLKMMKRRHTVDRMFELRGMCNKDTKLILDFIVGFPGETDEMFNETLCNLKKLMPRNVSVLCYSDRVGTEANMSNEKISRDVVCRRYHELVNALSDFEVNENSVKMNCRDVFMSRMSDRYLRNIDVSSYMKVECLDNIEAIKCLVESENKKIVINLKDIHDMKRFGVYTQFLTKRLGFDIMIDVDLDSECIDEIMNGSIDLYVLLHSEHYIRFNLKNIDSQLYMKFGSFEKFIVENYYFLKCQMDSLRVQLGII